MCGITGVISLDKPNINVDYIKPMADKIAHRGPDDAGYLCFYTGTKQHREKSFFQNLTDSKYFDKNNALPVIDSNHVQRLLNNNNYDLYMGHRRLSILDVSYAGHQPMSDLSQNIWVTYNGEIYNFIELKVELKRLGHKFRSNSDTEIIIYAYLEWGIDCIKKFNGMFAFSLYDNYKKKFYLVRDRYGIKPVYYHFSDSNNFIYASEIKSILEYKDYKSEINKEALIEYFTFQNIFTNKTLHKNIQILEPGNYFEIDLVTKKLKQEQFWDFEFNENTEIFKDERDYIEELERLFNQAVKRQLISDVQVGSYLSGGIDSGSISAIASRYFKKTDNDLKTFTVGFDLTNASGIELAFDERDAAKFMSSSFKTEHYETILKSGDIEKCINKFTYHLEEPRVGQSYPNYYAAKLASKYVKVVLSGTGSDELFAGYPWRYYSAVESDNFEDYIDKYYFFWQRLIPNTDIKNIFNPIATDIEGVWTRDIFSDIFKNIKPTETRESYINQSLYFEAKTFLHGLLVVEDKLSMAHSLETRVPYLDNDLVDFAQKIPVNYKLTNLSNKNRMNENQIGKSQRNKDGKKILRQAMQSYLPNNILSASKQGFSSPDNSWFKGDSINFVCKKLLIDDAKIYQYMDKTITQKMINEHLSGNRNRRLFIWSLLNFEEWCEVYG
tara:strand:- start:136 stop:2139 length:2004 start_codon:yes stop_codon:yes gene_type:complete